MQTNLPQHSYLFVETTSQPTLAVHSADSDVHSDSVALQTHCSDFCLEGSRGISGLFWVQHVGVTLGLERVSPAEEVGHAGPPMPTILGYMHVTSELINNTSVFFPVYPKKTYLMSNVFIYIYIYICDPVFRPRGPPPPPRMGWVPR